MYLEVIHTTLHELLGTNQITIAEFYVGHGNIHVIPPKSMIHCITIVVQLIEKEFGMAACHDLI